MLIPVHVSKAKKNGHTHYVVLPAALWRCLNWRDGDAVALRQAGDKVILERVALEELARIRTGEAEVRA